MISPHKEDKVIDIGSGKCELLIRSVETYQVSATAIEMYEAANDEAKNRARSRIPEDSIEYIVEDAKSAMERCNNMM